MFQIHGADFPFRTLHCRPEQAVVELLLHCASSYRWLPRGFRHCVYFQCRNWDIVILDYSSESCLHVQVHRSGEGGLFKSRLMAMRSELLKSPYLVELGALHLNLADAKEDTVMSDSELVAEFSCDFESSSPTLACTLVDSARLDFDLSCSICLVHISGLPFAIT